MMRRQNAGQCSGLCEPTLLQVGHQAEQRRIGETNLCSRNTSTTGSGVVVAILAVATVGVSSILVGCAPTRESFPEYGGTLLISKYDEMLALDMASGKTLGIPWRAGDLNLYLQGAGPGDALTVVVDRGFVRGRTSADTTAYATVSAAMYYPLANQYTLIPQLSEPSFACNSIDFDKEANSFLYCGEFSAGQGVYCLDSVFSLVDDLTPVLMKGDTSSETIIPAGVFAPGNSVLVYEDGNVYSLERIRREKRLVCSGVLVAISPQRDKIAVCDGSYGSWHVSVLSLRDSTWMKVDDDKQRLYIGCFSPDGNVYAYTKVEGLLDDRKRVWLFDLRTGRHYRTNLTGSMSCLSSLYWTDRTFPEVASCK
jgi:hypothetical protein